MLGVISFAIKKVIITVSIVAIMIGTLIGWNWNWRKKRNNRLDGKINWYLYVCVWMFLTKDTIERGIIDNGKDKK